MIANLEKIETERERGGPLQFVVFLKEDYDAKFSSPPFVPLLHCFEHCMSGGDGALISQIRNLCKTELLIVLSEATGRANKPRFGRLARSAQARPCK